MLPMAGNLFRKIKLSKGNKPGSLTHCIFRILHAGHLKSGQSRNLPHYKPIGKYRNWLFCNINDTIRTHDTLHVVVMHDCLVSVPYFSFLSLWSNRWCRCIVAGILLDHQSSSSINSDHIEKDSRERNHFDDMSSWIDWYADFPPTWTWTWMNRHDLKGFDLTLTSESTLTFA